MAKRRPNPERIVAFLGEDLVKDLHQEYMPPARADQLRTYAAAQLFEFTQLDLDEVIAAVGGGFSICDPEVGGCCYWSAIAWASPSTSDLECIDPEYYDEEFEDGMTMDPQAFASALAQAVGWKSCYVRYNLVTEKGEIVPREAYYISPEP